MAISGASRTGSSQGGALHTRDILFVNNSNYQISSNHTDQHPARAKPFACMECVSEEVDEEDDMEELSLDTNHHLSDLVQELEQRAYSKFTAVRASSLRACGKKRQCPNEFREKIHTSPKRQRSEEPKKESEDDDDEYVFSDAEDSDGYGVKILRSRPMPTPSPSPTLHAASAELACPYYKSDASKYRLCLVTSLATAAQVKRHIETAHRRAEYCPRCYAEFKGDDACEARRSHITARQCKLNEGPSTVEGLHGDLMDRLYEWQPAAASPSWRRREQQWLDIWGIVFPDKPVPIPFSPFLDEREKYVRVLRSVQTFGDREGSGLVKRLLREKKLELEVLGLTGEGGLEILTRAAMVRLLKRVLLEA
ncbi:hypothetical protein QBC43DRAFT_311926 [Cladorrhinum sp. PSN259]|nr:hypothetical protein QBC43DRAFT_311926 [Cladorrhinum sp. PSN259]